jgi:hypothetical protein
MSIEKAIKAIEAFQGASLTRHLASLEAQAIGINSADARKICTDVAIDDSFIQSALDIKKVAGQINVIIHASSILHALQGLLEEGEIVESVSLGAANAGKPFDLETNQRIAEFKFIDWQGGAETIRQNSLFKDFYHLAEYPTHKHKYLYVVGTYYPVKFLNSARSLRSVLSKEPVILQAIEHQYGTKMTYVSDYFKAHQDAVSLCDISPYIGRTE